MCGFYQTNVNTNGNFLVQSLQKDKSHMSSVRMPPFKLY